MNSPNVGVEQFFPSLSHIWKFIQEYSWICFVQKLHFSKEFSKKYLNPSDESVPGVQGPGLSPESSSPFRSIQRQEYKDCCLFTVVRYSGAFEPNCGLPFPVVFYSWAEYRGTADVWRWSSSGMGVGSKIPFYFSGYGFNGPEVNESVMCDPCLTVQSYS